MSVLLNIGLIGCGRAAELIYVPSLRKFRDINVVAVVDPYDNRRELIVKSFNNCRSYSSVNKDFINKIDAAIICSPPETHISLASLLLQNNKYVLVEKPLALTMDGIEQLINIEKNSEASLMMGFNHRNWLPIAALRQELSKGLKVISAEIVFSGNYDAWNPVSFKANALNDLGPHVFDLIQFIFDKPFISVTAAKTDEDGFGIKVKLSNNILINCRIAHCEKNEKTIRVKTAAGNLVVKFGSIRIRPAESIQRNILDLSDNLKNKLLRKTSPVKESFDIQLNNFFNLIKENKKPVPGIKDGINAVLAAEASVKSLNENGKEIFFNGVT